jgi:hypothetical protein
MSPEDYASAPEQPTVRELHAGGKVLVTTLLCPKRTPRCELKALYRQRWHIELDLRHIKTTMGMQVLSCKTPCMAEKEIWVYLLAYNLIRVIMAEAEVLSGCSPRQVSFKHSVQLWISWYRHELDCEQGCFGGSLLPIAQQRVGERPGRIEPRATKRGNKPYPPLTMIRSKARKRVRQHGHPKTLK